MIYEYFLCLVFFFIILATTQGYGIFLKEIILDKKIILNQSEIGIIGFFFLLILSILTHFFIPLSSYSNSIIVLIGIIFYIINLKYFWSVNIKYFFPIIIFLSILSFSFEYHSDYFWYHLPYINLLANNKIIFGSSNLNDFFGYGHGWLDIMAIFNLPIFESYFTSFVSIIFITYYIYFLISLFQYSKDDILKTWSLLCLIFFFLQYPLLKDYGAEIHMNLLYVMICLNIYLFYYRAENKENYFLLIIFLTTFVFFLRLNAIIFLPLILLFFTLNYKYLFNFFNNRVKLFLFFLVSIVLLILKNIIISGCIAYPIYFTCFDNFSWGTGFNQAYERFQMLSAQSKGYLLYVVYEKNYETIYNFYQFAKSENFISPNEYLNQIGNWLIYWLKYEHDKERIGNIILILFSVIIFTRAFHFKSLIIFENLKIIKNNFWLIILFFLPIISYFILLPQGRYGGFGIFFILFSFITSILIINKSDKNYAVLTILSISIVYFIFKNYDNISQNKHVSIYNTYPTTEINKVETKIYTNDIVIHFLSPELEGKPRYCNDERQLCTSSYRKKCIENIYYKFDYLFVKPNKNQCTKVIQDYFFF